MISSLDNSKIKNLLKLIKKSRERKKQGVAVVDGKKEILAAVRAGLKIVDLFYCPALGGKLDDFSISEDFAEETEEKVFKEISYKENPDGYLAVVLVKSFPLEDLKISKNPLLFVLEGTEKPGNLGAIARTADAAGVDAIIVNDPVMDIYNPNAIRASRGAIFTRPVICAPKEETIKWLLANKIKSFAASDKANRVYTDCDFSNPTAIILGAEHEGLGEEWQKAADELVRIPMAGISDSLNLSVSAAIIVFEALRQRKNKS